MYNLLSSLAAGAAVALAIALGTSFGWVAAVFPGLLVTTALYVYIAYRIRKRLDAINEVVQRELTARRVEKAIQALQGGFALSRWQFLVSNQLHGSIGIGADDGAAGDHFRDGRRRIDRFHEDRSVLHQPIERGQRHGLRTDRPHLGGIGKRRGGHRPPIGLGQQDDQIVVKGDCL
jgi:hypothetical protein